MPAFNRGDVVSVPLDPAMGHEQKGTRPALSFQAPYFWWSRGFEPDAAYPADPSDVKVAREKGWLDARYHCVHRRHQGGCLRCDIVDRTPQDLGRQGRRIVGKRM